MPAAGNASAHIARLTRTQGTLTEHREGAGTIEHRTGASFSEGKSTTHWAENKGSEAVIVIAVDVFKP